MYTENCIKGKTIMTLLLEIITLGLAVAFCIQQIKALLKALKTDKSEKRHNASAYKAGCYQVRWH